MKRLLKLTGEDILAMQHVSRWHMVRTTRQQSLAEHSGTVAMLAFKLYQYCVVEDDEYDKECMLKILDLALTHDSHEVEFGDLPSIMKGFVPDGTEEAMESHFWDRRGVHPEDGVSPLIEKLVKVADTLEAVLFYELEGTDPQIKEKLRNKLRRMSDDLPEKARDFIWALVWKVRERTFTPQPTK